MCCLRPIQGANWALANERMHYDMHYIGNFPYQGISNAAEYIDKLLIYNGAGEVIRTPDLLITNQLLYQLSYPGTDLE